MTTALVTAVTGRAGGAASTASATVVLTAHRHRASVCRGAAQAGVIRNNARSDNRDALVDAARSRPAMKQASTDNRNELAEAERPRPV